MNSRQVLDVRPIIYDSYLATIRNSPGSNLFRNYYAKVDGTKTDILRDGLLSCAKFVSSILYLNKLCYDMHGTVEGTIKDMVLSGWKKITRPRLGAVLVWQPIAKPEDKTYWQHDHIGFYMGENKAISTNKKTRNPTVHHWTFGVKDKKPTRKVESVYWHPKLENK